MTERSKGRIALLYDCTYPHVAGGGQKRLFEVFRRLAADGWEVDWYGLKWWQGEETEEVAGIRFIPVAQPVPLYGANGKRSIAQTLHYGKAIARFPAIGAYDIVHMGQWPYFHFFPARLYSLFRKAKISVDWWEVWAGHWREYYGAKGYLGVALERVCARIPDHIVAISETGRAQLEGLGVKSSKISVIHNGIDFGAIDSASPSAAGWDMIYLGRLQPHKNVNLLVEALAILKARGQSLRLTVIGDGPQREALTTLAGSLGVGDQVRWLGAIEKDEDVYSLLRSARLFVHPSTKEGGGSITSLEANAAGLPVIAFSHPGGISPELIVEGVNGAWVAEVSAEALAASIEQCFKRIGSAEGSMASSFARDFDWSGIAARYDTMFGDILGKRV
jgi:glycosyltransferase involved in cell wall biosynthesis